MELPVGNSLNRTREKGENAKQGGGKKKKPQKQRRKPSAKLTQVQDLEPKIVKNGGFQFTS